MESNSTVGERIKNIRANQGMNLEKFGSLVKNASKGLVSNWEHGTNLPNSERLKIIADMGNISVSELLYGKDDEKIAEAEHFFKIIQSKKDPFGLKISENEIKALAYFSGVDKRRLIVEAMTRLDKINDSAGTRTKNYSNIIFAYQLISVFSEKYREIVKTNSNLVDIIQSKLDDLYTYVEDYRDYTDKSLSGLVGDGLSVDVEMYTSSVNKKLIDQLQAQLKKTIKETRNIGKKYPDEDYKFDIDILALKNTKPNSNSDESRTFKLFKKMRFDTKTKKFYIKSKNTKDFSKSDVNRLNKIANIPYKEIEKLVDKSLKKQ